MNGNSEIPCSKCDKWDAKATSFSCKPYECLKLSEWLSKYAQIQLAENVHFGVIPIQYVV